jgi:cytochrome d ubiquinol oxidase subunit II
MGDLTVLQSVWFVAIALLWTLYLVLEGFDFGVGMLIGRVRGSRAGGDEGDHHDRRVALHAIGPTWAANEVWVVIAVVGMFGAFPGWYAAWSSSLYLPLLLVLLALISRNVAIELIGKREDERWRRGWERVLLVASTLAPFAWGLVWSAALHGVALRGEEAVGGPLDALSPYSLLGGVALVALCRALGAAFLTLRTEGAVRARAAGSLRRSAPAAAVLVGALLVWTAVGVGGLGVVGWVAFAACAGALAVLVAGALRAARAAGRAVAATAAPNSVDLDGSVAHGSTQSRGPGQAFAAGCVAVGALVAVWFAALFPAGLNGADGGAGLALADVAAGSYTLTLMTVLTAVMLPLLLAIQAWSYWLFRERVTRAAVGAPLPSPVELIARVAEQRGWGDGGAGVASAGGGGAGAGTGGRGAGARGAGGTGAGGRGAGGGGAGGRGAGAASAGGGGAAGGSTGDGARRGGW